MLIRFFISAGGLLTALFIPAHADTLGEGLSSLPWRTLYGEAVALTENGTVTLVRTNPQTNQSEEFTIFQRNVLGLDAATIALFSGERLTCAIALETNTVIYADCGMAVIQENARQRLTILTYLAETSPALVGCSPSERDLFRQNGQPECVVDALE